MHHVELLGYGVIPIDNLLRGQVFAPALSVVLDDNTRLSPLGIMRKGTALGQRILGFDLLIQVAGGIVCSLQCSNLNPSVSTILIVLLRA